MALKVLRDAHPPARVIERFFREARAAAQLDHPNIVGLYDAGRDAGRCWIAYQYVAGDHPQPTPRGATPRPPRDRAGSSATWPTRSTTRTAAASTTAT